MYVLCISICFVLRSDDAAFVYGGTRSLDTKRHASCLRNFPTSLTSLPILASLVSPETKDRLPQVGDRVDCMISTLTPTLALDIGVMATSPQVGLWLYSESNKIDILVLSIPLAVFGDYATKPLKWLKYLGYAIYGAEGCLSTSKAGPEIDNLDAAVEARPYYFNSQSKSDLSHFMILAKPINHFRRTSLR